MRVGYKDKPEKTKTGEPMYVKIRKRTRAKMLLTERSSDCVFLTSRLYKKKNFLSLYIQNLYDIDKNP